MNADPGIITCEVFIAARPETVFGFLIDPVLMARWIGLSHVLEPHPGGLFQVEVSSGNVARGVYTEVVPPSRVVFTWGWDSDDPNPALTPPGASLVEIDLEPKESGTLLRLRHSRLPDETSAMHRERWSFYLDRLRASACNRHGRPAGLTIMQPPSGDPSQLGSIRCNGAINENENSSTDGQVQSLPSGGVRHVDGLEET